MCWTSSISAHYAINSGWRGVAQEEIVSKPAAAISLHHSRLDGAGGLRLVEEY
jgi:hypothetical protein